MPLYTQAFGVNGDGSVIVGERRSFTVPEQANAFRYVNGVYQALPAPAGFALGSAQGVSADGSVIVGITGTSGTAPSRPARWNQAGVPQAVSLPRSGDIGGWFTGVNRDGRVAIGISGGSTARAFTV